MIPTDLLNVGRLRLPADTSVQQVAPSQAVTDLLAELVPGQRIMAEIQAALPNGTYRALINQREITLALPFSAKSGDSLEMAVVENNGRTALAVMSRGEPAPLPEGSTATSLSKTGQLIADLFGKAPESGKGQATPLNGNTPLTDNPRIAPQDLAPLLKQAISSSGVFYESHQAKWTTGQYSLDALLQEPQAKGGTSAPLPPPAQTQTVPQHETLPQAQGTPLLEKAIPQTIPTLTNRPAGLQPEAAAPPSSAPLQGFPQGIPSPVAEALVPLVRQQLESLANNTYAWQGQVWPGQTMQWEIVEEDGRQQRGAATDEPASIWHTRLHLDLPNLGAVDARIGLRDGKLDLRLAAAVPATRDQLRREGSQLAGQMEAAGLALSGFQVDNNAPPDA